MEEAPETNRVLQLQLRAGELEVIAGVLRDLPDYSWYRDDFGRAWSWEYDIDRNLHRWFIGYVFMFDRSYISVEQEHLRGAPLTFTYYGWNNGLWRADGIGGPYRPIMLERS